MANEEHLELLKQGSSVWNAWRAHHWNEVLDLSEADLRRADLSNTHLSRANLYKADLYKVDLSEAELYRADLRSANLSGADLSGADLSEANLSEADLRGANLYYLNADDVDFSEADLGNANLRGAALKGANLSGADLYAANFSGADITDADFSRAITLVTIFTDVDLSVAKGLETIKQEGPSHISIDTIYRSQGKIPERFLRDAGVPDSFLEYMHSLIGQPIRYFTCFISHSHHDQRFCDRLYSDLRHHDVPSWYFPEDAIWGKTIWGEIDRSIKVYDRLVVVCSEHSLRSPAVQREIERALQREDREGKNILFPLRLDEYLFHEWEHERKADVVNKIAGDFCGWENSAEQYDKAFKRFLKALKAEDATSV